MPTEAEVYSKFEGASFLTVGIVYDYCPPGHLTKVIHLFNGVFLCASILLLSMVRAMLTAAYHRWEFFTTLDFEWEVFTGRRPWKWSFAVYFIARLMAMASTILTFIGFNVTAEINCIVCGYSHASIRYPRN
jgi:hypothetical protein